MRTSTRQAGFSLIEVVIFIVIVGIAVAAITSQYVQNVQHSAEPLLRQKALAIANTHMDTIQGLPFASVSGYTDSSVTGFTTTVAVSNSAWSATSPAETIASANVKKVDVTVSISATAESLSFTLYRTSY